MLNVKRDYIKSKNTRSQNTGTRKNPPPGVFSLIPKKFEKENRRDFEGIRNCIYEGRESAPPSESPSVVAWKNQKIFPRNLAFALQTSISSHGDNVVFVLTSCPMKEQKTLILLNGHLVTIDEYREWIEDQQR